MNTKLERKVRADAVPKTKVDVHILESSSKFGTNSAAQNLRLKSYLRILDDNSYPSGWHVACREINAFPPTELPNYN
jgi:hypothetical protein